MFYIYILKLEDKSSGYKYYIGKSNNPLRRVEEHNNSNGASWTKKYKPIEVIDIIATNDPFDEDKYTIQYMEKYGIDNVRGGSFCLIKLSPSTKKFITQMINGKLDKCFKCGQSGHFANTCEVKTVCYKCNSGEHITKDCTEIYCNNCKELGHLIKDCSKIKCFKCKKIGHHGNICTELFCTNCKKIGHIIIDCTDIKCFKCNIMGHHGKKCTMNMICYKCKENGHLGKDCTKYIPNYQNKQYNMPLKNDINTKKFTCIKRFETDDDDLFSELDPFNKTPFMVATHVVAKPVVATPMVANVVTSVVANIAKTVVANVAKSVVATPMVANVATPMVTNVAPVAIKSELPVTSTKSVLPKSASNLFGDSDDEPNFKVKKSLFDDLDEEDTFITKATNTSIPSKPIIPIIPPKPIPAPRNLKLVKNNPIINHDTNQKLEPKTIPVSNNVCNTVKALANLFEVKEEKQNMLTPKSKPPIMPKPQIMNKPSETNEIKETKNVQPVPKPPIMPKPLDTNKIQDTKIIPPVPKPRIKAPEPVVSSVKDMAKKLEASINVNSLLPKANVPIPPPIRIIKPNQEPIITISAPPPPQPQHNPKPIVSPVTPLSPVLAVPPPKIQPSKPVEQTLPPVKPNSLFDEPEPNNYNNNNYNYNYNNQYCNPYANALVQQRIFQENLNEHLSNICQLYFDRY